MKHFCPYCESAELAQVLFTEAVKTGRRSVPVEGLEKLTCTECGESHIPLDMHDRNAKRIQDVLNTTQSAVSLGLLRRLRETLGLTQREASLIFGAGESAFAKWESGQANMSTPSALLVQCALNVPGVAPYLAKLASVELQPSSPEAHGVQSVPGAQSIQGADHEEVRFVQRSSHVGGGLTLTLISGGTGHHRVRARVPSSSDFTHQTHYWMREPLLENAA